MGRVSKGVQYDRLIAEANEILERDNPCEATCTSCLNSKMIPGAKPFCCDGCEHLSAAGCMVDALACKVWLCHTAQARYPATAKALNDVKVKAQAVGIPMFFRGSKEQHLSTHSRYVQPLARG